MKMAKASEKDMETSLLLQGILNDIDSGNFPRGINGEFSESDPDCFDQDEKLHLLALYDRIKYCLNITPGGLMRVIWGFHTLMHNDIVDPNDSCLALNPRIGDCVKACEGIPDNVLNSWLNPPDGSLGAPHGTWAAQLAEAGRRQVELLASLKVLRERHQIDDPHHANLCEYCKQADAAILKAEGKIKELLP